MVMPDTTRPLAAALRDSPAAALLDRWATAQAAAAIVAPLAQAVAARLDLRVPGACDLRDSVLHLAVPSAAEAAKLRQIEPRLIAALVAHGFAVYGMKVRVQAGATPYPGQGSPPGSSSGEPFTPASSASVAAVKHGAATLHAPALAQALDRLADALARHRARAAAR
jgi:hypothetical protein